MVVLTVVAQNNGETLHFVKSIPKVNIMRFVSCSLFNSWNTLQNEGEASLRDEKKDVSVSVSKIHPGHYDLESLAKEITNLFSQYNYNGLQTEANTPLGQLAINNFGRKQINLDRDLAKLSGIGRTLLLKIIMKQLTSPTTYFIHCDLIDKNQNLFNGKQSDILAKFDIRGKPYEIINYIYPPDQILRDSSTEFQLIMIEYCQYHVLKEAVWAKLSRQISRLDIKKIKKDLRWILSVSCAEQEPRSTFSIGRG